MLHGVVFEVESVLNHDVVFPVEFNQQGLVDDVFECMI